MSEQLAADRLGDYLEAYLRNEEAFQQAIEADVELLQSPEPFPETYKRLRSGLDDD